MRSFFAFFKKELLACMRSGRMLILGILFFAFGIMNPAIAKLTPWLFDLLSEELAEGGWIITEVEVSALTSWTQFFKNIPLALVVFVLLFSGSFTGEYTSGALLLLLTKGLPRSRVVLAKWTIQELLWTAGYLLCAAVTYGYNAFYWDNDVAQHLLPALVFWWLFGAMTISLMTLFSTMAKSHIGVLLGTGGVVLASYLAGLLPRLSKAVPTALMAGNALTMGTEMPGAYLGAVMVAAVATVACPLAGILIFHKRQL